MPVYFGKSEAETGREGHQEALQCSQEAALGREVPNYPPKVRIAGKYCANWPFIRQNWQLVVD